MFKKLEKWIVFIVIFGLQLLKVDGGPGDIELSTSFAFPVYNFYIWNKDNGHTKKYNEPVYWKHLEMAYHKNPQAIMMALQQSQQPKQTIQQQRKIVTDHYGRQMIWHPRFGYIPIVTGAFNQPDIKSVPIRLKHTPAGPVAWLDTASGRVPVPRLPNGPLKPGQNVPGTTDLFQRNIPAWCHMRLAEYIPPVMASDGPSMDPCNPIQQEQSQEFGMTATSNMADMLCSFCQVIKHLDCVWQFCSHPEGIYKINLNDKPLF